MDYAPEQQARLAELAQRKAELEATVTAMRDRGEPVRGDYSSRAAYRAAAAKYRRRG